MNKQLFERNILALSKTNPVLCSRLSSVAATTETYRFIESRSGEIIPALAMGGASRPLHSTVDPRREGERLVSTLAEEGYLVFLGLGGAFAAEHALKREATRKVLVIEYDYDGLAELLRSFDYTRLFEDKRFRLLCDSEPAALELFVVNHYLPALDGGIRVFPLRVRTESDPRFTAAADALKRAVDSVSRDYSVQAYFGKRWFSNIIRNLPLAEKQKAVLPSIEKAIIIAAGPSLEEQLPGIKVGLKKQAGPYMIAVDTALPALIHANIEPDAVISIDCQYISYHHFFGVLPEKTKLFLDLASPPSIAARAKNRLFFSGGHPLSLYIARRRPLLPVVDTSGGNVTYAALSLAEKCGAKEVVLYGADFSYPLGKTYARGTYVYPYFEKLESRFAPVEAQHSVLLYRDSSLKKITTGKSFWYYETDSLRFYRKKALQKLRAITESAPKRAAVFSSGEPVESADSFLAGYLSAIEKLSSFTPAGEKEQELVATLLPLAAFFRRLAPASNPTELFTSVQSFCREELEKLIGELAKVIQRTHQN